MPTSAVVSISTYGGVNHEAIFSVPLPVACFFEGLKWLGACPVTQFGKSSAGRDERFSPIMLTLEL